MNFTFSIEAINLILHALSKLPYEMSADLITEVRKQAQPQVEAMQAQATPAQEVQE